MRPIVYVHPYSTYSRRIRLQVTEKDLTEEQIELKFINMAKLEHRRAPYTDLNPFGRVPTLVLGETVVIESASIMFYLETLFPNKSLLPVSSERRIELDYHLRLCDEFAAKLTPIYFAKRFQAETKWPDKKEVAGLNKWGNKFLKNIGGLLRCEPFLLGNELTLLDLAYLPFFHFLELTELKVPEHLLEWQKTMDERASVKETVPSQ